MRITVACGFFRFLALLINTVSSWEATNFEWVKSDDGELLCGTSPPNKTVKAIPSRALCTASCFRVCPLPCHAVNYWKRSQVCQHFYYLPRSYAVQQDCVNYRVTTRLLSPAVSKLCSWATIDFRNEFLEIGLTCHSVGLIEGQRGCLPGIVKHRVGLRRSQ